MMLRKKSLLILAVLILLGGSFGCASAPVSHALMLAPLDQMSMAVQAAPTATQQSYRFAAANADVLRHIPCYCGCNKLGHKSNYDCYISGQAATGQFSYSSHALGCTICVDITQEAMRLMRQGQSPAQIRDAIDTSFAHYGPGNRALGE